MPEFKIYNNGGINLDLIVAFDYDEDGPSLTIDFAAPMPADVVGVATSFYRRHYEGQAARDMWRMLVKLSTLVIVPKR